MLPSELKNYNLFIEGRGYAGRVSEMTLPKLTRKTEEDRGGGMNVPVEVDMGMEKLEMEFTLREFSPEVLRQWGVTDSAAVELRFLGAALSDDLGANTDAIEVVVRGRWRELDFGTHKSGEATELKVMVACAYFKYIVNNSTQIEIDSVGMIENVGGSDRLAEQRRALGL